MTKTTVYAIGLKMRVELPWRYSPNNDPDNPYSFWLTRVDSPCALGALIPGTRSKHREKRRLGKRVKEEIDQYVDIHTAISDQYAGRLSVPFAGHERELLKPDKHDVEFRSAVGEFVGKKMDSSDELLSHVLVVNSGPVTHDVTLPFELGAYSDEINFLGPFYDNTSTLLFKRVFGLDKKLSQITYDDLLQQFHEQSAINETRSGYDLILVYNHNSDMDAASQPQPTFAQLAEALANVLNPNGRIITSSAPELDELRDAFTIDESSLGLDIERREDILFVDMDYPAAYIPQRGDTSHRAVLSISKRSLAEEIPALELDEMEQSFTPLQTSTPSLATDEGEKTLYFAPSKRSVRLLMAASLTAAGGIIAGVTLLPNLFDNNSSEGQIGVSASNLGIGDNEPSSNSIPSEPVSPQTASPASVVFEEDATDQSSSEIAFGENFYFTQYGGNWYESGDTTDIFVQNGNIISKTTTGKPLTWGGKPCKIIISGTQAPDKLVCKES